MLTVLKKVVARMEIYVEFLTINTIQLIIQNKVRFGLVTFFKELTQILA